MLFLGNSSTPRGNSGNSKGADGKKPVECEICHKTLADPSSLYRHRKMHAGIKPHQCPHCDKSFGQRLDIIFPSFFVIFCHFPSYSVIFLHSLSLNLKLRPIPATFIAIEKCSTKESLSSF